MESVFVSFSKVNRLSRSRVIILQFDLVVIRVRNTTCDTRRMLGDLAAVVKKNKGKLCSKTEKHLEIIEKLRNVGGIFEEF